MKTNMGTIDRGGRIVIAVLLLVLTLVTNTLTGPLYWLAIVVAGVFMLTAVVGNCPLYSIVGLKTCRDC